MDRIKQMMITIGKRLKRHRNTYALVCSLGLGLVWSLVGLFEQIQHSISYGYPVSGTDVFEELFSALVIAVVLGVFIVLPFALTWLNLKALFRKADSDMRRAEHRTEWITIVLGAIYSLLFQEFSEIQYRADWQQVLYNNQLHAPIWTEAVLTVAVLACFGILGYILLSVRNVNFIPPLVTVCGISAVYMGMAMCILWIIQVFPHEKFLCLFPLNCVLIGVRTIQCTVEEWQGNRENQECRYRNRFLQWVHGMLLDASRWPVAALLLMVPLLGILIAVLVLFGQRPDSIIRAWTETSDWQMSRQMAPPNLHYDNHYLCTVAAQGHTGVVKPLRKGIRHGHEVTVNRQLCIANAFEQVLEERVPWLHRPIRRFYDTYGFPVAKLIRSKYAADVVYLIMKPLEWVFLAVLYLVDVKPENRIAVQYPHAPIPDIEAILMPIGNQ